MSSTEVYGAFEDGDMVKVGAIKNSHGGAMHVWRALGEKYLGSFSVFADLGRLWRLSDDPRLSEAERIVHISTFDRAFVRRENILRVADALEAFVPASDNLKLQASLLRTAYRDGARVVGWQQTTARSAKADGRNATPEYYAWLCEQIEPDVDGLTVEQAAAVEAAAIKDAADFFAEFGEAFDTEETDWEAVAWTSGVSEETMPGASGEQQAAGLALYTAVLTRETKRLASE